MMYYNARNCNLAAESTELHCCIIRISLALVLYPINVLLIMKLCTINNNLLKLKN